MFYRGSLLIWPRNCSELFQNEKISDSFWEILRVRTRGRCASAVDDTCERIGDPVMLGRAILTVSAPAVPLLWNTNNGFRWSVLLKVPQRCTTVPEPICAPPVSQFAALLKKGGVCTLVVQTPEVAPVCVMYILAACAWAFAPRANRQGKELQQIFSTHHAVIESDCARSDTRRGVIDYGNIDRVGGWPF